MVRRIGKNLGVLDREMPPASEQLQRDGYTVLREVLGPNELAALAADVERVFAQPPVDPRDRDEFRYEMLNRSALAQAVVGHERILNTIEPLLGDDCHVIANTAWRNPPGFTGGPWHCDAGPHVPRPKDVAWDDRIPYPVFAIGAHILLRECATEDGPTAVVPGSNRSGRMAPRGHLTDPDLDYDGRPPVLLTGAAGDVVLFVSDAWHRGTPAGPTGRGRFFLQAHYGRRDIAQRIHTTEHAHHLSVEALGRAATPRQRSLVGLHDPYFYDA